MCSPFKKDHRRASVSLPRSGFVALAGRPNAGKSTLVNRIVGGKVAIVSDKPQTTRREIRGIATGEDWQLVLVDLPGVQRPRDPLTERMQHSVERALAGPTPSSSCARRAKIDLATAPRQRDHQRRHPPRRRSHVTASTARARSGLLGLVSASRRDLPISPGWAKAWPARRAARVSASGGRLSLSTPGEHAFAHIGSRSSARAGAAAYAREVPHAVGSRWTRSTTRGRPGDPLPIWLRVESQKGILVGSGGRMVKAVGSAARREIEATLGRRVHLELQVRVRKGWRRDEALLDRLGIE